jgi:undecaprenyl-diphosphatase
LPIYQAVVLAIIQGLAEFIPVSSSGHLIIVRRLLGWNELSPAHELTFDVALHFGTLLSVLFYFRRTWFQIVRAAFGGKIVRFSEAGGSDEHIVLIAAALILVALLMWLAEKVGTREKPLTRISFADSLVVGVAQAFALLPGVSRSGSTITAGLFRNMTREAAVRFSFLLSTPLIAGAALLKAYEVHKEGLPAGMQAPFLVGIAVSAIVGYATIAWLIRYLQFNTLRVFIIYRVVVGIVVIALAYVWHLQ